MADIAETLLTSGSDSTLSQTFDTASITPTANRLILIAIYVFRLGSTNVPDSVTGNGITYTLVEDLAFVTPGNADSHLFLFRGLDASPSTGAITIDMGTSAHHSCTWIVTEYANVDTGGVNGADAVVQFDPVDGGSVAADTEVAAALAAFGHANNATYIMAGVDFAEDLTADVLDPSAGLTESAEVNENTDSIHLAAAFRADNDQTPGYDHNSSSSRDLAVIGAELKNADQGAGGANTRRYGLTTLGVG